jgi:hypothetical protein
MSEFLENVIARSISSPAVVSPGRILAPRLPGLFEAPTGIDLASDPRAEGSADPLTASTLLANLDSGNRSAGFDPAMEAPLASNHSFLRPLLQRANSNGSFLRAQAGQTISLQDPSSELADSDEGFFNPDGLTEGESPENPRINKQKQPGSLAEEERKAHPAHLIRPAIAPIQKEMGPSAQLPIAAVSTPGGQVGENESSGRLEFSSKTPSVHIRIDRIDVRVTPIASQPSPSPVSTPRPKLNLDDYLRQRNEGKR